MIDIDDIEAAARRLHGIVIETPLLQNAELDRIAAGKVLLKPECWQRTGSFKIRGAYNLLRQLSAEQAERGIVAWSSGNHAQGVAAAGKMLGIRTAIVMPEDAPTAKLDSTRKLGGEIITYDRYTGDREAIARPWLLSVVPRSYRRSIILTSWPGRARSGSRLQNNLSRWGCMRIRC